MGEIESLVSGIERLRREMARRAGPCYAQQEPFGSQQAFLDLDCFEALYGGAAGGGKSSALLMAALEYVDRPGYNALILRRTYRDLALPGAIMDRAREWLSNTDAHWNGIDKQWMFPSGAKLQFGYLDTEIDKYRYQGSELSFIAFDELTQFHESQYTYLLSRLRRLKGSDTPLRARAATNPGGIGHEWVKRRFVDEAERGGRVFIPAKLSDNPFLDQVSYTEALSNLDSITRRQLLDGEWIQDTSGLVYRFAEFRNTLKTVPQGRWTYILGIDFGINDKTAFTVVGWREYDQILYVLESFGESGTIPSAAAEIVKQLSAKYEFERIIGDTGGMGKAFTEEMRRRYHIPIMPADKQNKIGYISLLNGMLEQGMLKIHVHMAGQLIKEMMALPWHPNKQKEHDGFDNHCTDSCLYATRAAYAYIEGQSPTPKPVVGTHEYYEAQARAIEEKAEEDWNRRQREQEW